MFGDRRRSEPKSESDRQRTERTRPRRVRPLPAALVALAGTVAALAFLRRRSATPKLEPPF